MPRLDTISVDAREDSFRIVQLRGNLFVCSRANGSCCCGWVEKGRMPFDNQELWGAEWERRKIRNRVHLTFTGCLGPCPTGNNALLQLFGHSVWFKDLNDPALPGAVYDYIDACLGADALMPVPPVLHGHVMARYLDASAETDATDGLAFLDPVCLMEVDPATARWTTEYDGRLIGFCAPSCRKQFLADPAAYLVA
jgi:cobaltochelatase CobN